MTNSNSNSRKRADAARSRADRLHQTFREQSERAHAMYGRFEGGQPLLRGHHSYRSAVRDKRRADAASDRAIDTFKEAQRAESLAKFVEAKAAAEERVASYTEARTRPWRPEDFQPGDIVRVRTFQHHIDVYRVKRVNRKTLTLDGGGGGMDDPKREYDRVLSRTRDGETVTDPGALD